MTSFVHVTPSVDDTATGFGPAKSLPAATKPAGVAITVTSRSWGSGDPGQTRCQPAATDGIAGPMGGIGRDAAGLLTAGEADGANEGAIVAVGGVEGGLGGAGNGVTEEQPANSTMEMANGTTEWRKGYLTGLRRPGGIAM